jgi:hypothetical protein
MNAKYILSHALSLLPRPNKNVHALCIYMVIIIPLHCMRFTWPSYPGLGILYEHTGLFPWISLLARRQFVSKYMFIEMYLNDT